ALASGRQPRRLRAWSSTVRPASGADRGADRSEPETLARSPASTFSLALPTVKAVLSSLPTAGELVKAISTGESASAGCASSAGSYIDFGPPCLSVRLRG